MTSTMLNKQPQVSKSTLNVSKPPDINDIKSFEKFYETSKQLEQIKSSLGVKPIQLSILFI